MDEINWLTVIVSVCLSAITVIIILRIIMGKLLDEIEKIDHEFIEELEQVKTKVIHKIKKLQL